MRHRNIAEVLTGAVVPLVAAGFLAYAVANSGRSTASGYPLHAKFDHIDGLGVGADVRLAGVKIGSVTEESIDPQTFLALVTLTVRNDLKLPTDSAAIITSESLLGGKYLSLQAGGDETMLQPGQSITITQSSVSLEELLGKFIFSMTNVQKTTQGGTTPGGPRETRQQGTVPK